MRTYLCKLGAESAKRQGFLWVGATAPTGAPPATPSDTVGLVGSGSKLTLWCLLDAGTSYVATPWLGDRSSGSWAPGTPVTVTTNKAIDLALAAENLVFVQLSNFVGGGTATVVATRNGTQPGEN